MIRAALRSLLARKLRLVMSTFAIVLGVAFVVGTLIFSDTLNRSFTALFASTVGDVVVRPVGGTTEAGGPSSATLPAALVDELAALPGAARADGNVTAIGVYVVDSDGKAVGGYGPPALGLNDNDAPAAGGEGLALVAGESPVGPDELALDQVTAESAGYQIGDTVPVLLPRGDPDRIEATLTGLVGFPEGGSLNGATLVVLDTPTAQDLFLDGEEAFNDIWVTARDGVSQEELAAEASGLLPDGVEAVTGDAAADESADELLDAISFLTTFLLIFAGISLVVGSFLIVNTFSMLVAQRSRELALLRALGASRVQVVASVQAEAAVLGVVGSTIGLGLGVLLAVALRALFAQVGLDLSGQSLVFTPRVVVAAYAVGILVTAVAALAPALRTVRIAPVQALRDDVALPEASLARRFRGGLALFVLGCLSLVAGLTDLLDDVVDAGGWFTGAGVLLVLLGTTAMSPVLAQPFLGATRRAYAAVFGSVGNLAGQNSLRNPRRTTATASALMIGLTLACTMAIVGDSAKASTDRAIEQNFVGDYVVSNTFGGELNPALADQVAAVDGVASVARERFALAQEDGDARALAATDRAGLALFDPVFVEGAPDDLVDGTVVLKEDFAADRDLGVGDELTVTVPAGEQTWTVAGVIEDNPVIFTPVLTTIGTLEAGGFPAADYVLFVTAEDEAGATARDGLDDLVADLPVVSVKDQQEFAADQRAQIDQFVLIIYALLGLALLIAVLGIVNTLALSVIERTREIGLLRAVGLTRGQLRRMITLESVVIAVLGALLGVVLGLGFGVSLMYAVRDQGLEVISVPFGQVAVFLLLAVVVGVLAAFWPARRAARLDVLEAIATE